MELGVLGPLEVAADDGPLPLGGAKQRAVLAHLLLRANTVVPAERLIDEVWEDDPPAAARNVLQTYVSRLRKTLGPERLEHRPGGYILHADPAEVDMHRFQTLIQEAGRRAVTDPEAGVRLYREADALWRGPALDDLADQPSLRAEIGRLEELRVAAVVQRITAELSLGRHAELVPELEVLASEHPHREGLWALLMTALYRAGRQGDALAAYRRARAVLVEELGLEPSPELRRLEEQVLRQDPALDVAGRPLRGFRLLERVGEGSFGVVHRALQPQVGREVAVKIVRPALANDPEFIRRFEAEAQLVARLEHPHIVPLYDYWREPDGAYLVMRYLKGGSLRDALATGPLALEPALGVVGHVGSALAAAHRQGVVHRDVKPANILLDEDGNAYLSDFGIARDVTVARTPERADTLDTSAYYLSPEEARGEAPTARADVYSLGLVLFEMLAGRHPFAGVRPQELVSGGTRAAVPALDTTPEVDEVVRRATENDPAERYEDATMLVAALAAAADATPAAFGGAVPAGPARNPYKGLRPFLEPDAADFEGREDLVGGLVERLASERLLALVGASGSGKSSAVRAGLVPAIRAGVIPGSDRWFIAEMIPGEDPFGELRAALVGLAAAAPPAGLVERLERDETGLVEAAAQVMPDAEAQLLLVIDQFEEVFTLVLDDDRRTRFLAALQSAATAPHSRVRIVLTLRADILDRPLAQPGFADVLRAGLELIVPLGPAELERAITAPARRVGVAVQEGLLAELVADVAGRPSALPLLQFTLAELFDRRGDGGLELDAYRALGGVGGAIARGAEDAYGALGDASRGAARQLFLRLAAAGDGTEVTRRRVPRSALLALSEDATDMEAAIEAFARLRLLSFDRDPDTREPTVEIAHDALLRAWDRLHGWVTAAREDLALQRQVAAAAHEWTGSDRDRSFLLRGSRLDQLVSWRAGSDIALTPEERTFLDASETERDRAAAEEEERRARERMLERRSARRLRGLVAVLAAAAVVAGALSVFAFDQRSDADRQRRTAVARELSSAAVANLDVDAERSILLALEAVDHTRSADGVVLPEAKDALHRAVITSRLALRVPGLGGALDWSSDGSLFVTEGRDGSGLIDVRDARNGRRVRAFPGHDPDVNLVSFSADGGMLATSGDDGTVKVWVPRTGERLHTFRGARGPVWGVAFSRDGSKLAASFWDEKVVRVWDLDSGRRVSEIGPVAASFTTSFSPDGRRLAIATFDAGAVLADVDSGRIGRRLTGQGPVSDVDWSPDGRRIATSSLDATVRIWDARAGRSRFTLFGHKGEVVAADWSADGRRLATGSSDGTARVWEVDADGTREAVTISAQERGGGLWVALSPDGERLMTGDQEITAVKVWDVGRGGGAEWANLPAATGSLGGVAFTPDGSGVAAGNADGSVTVYDAETAARSFTLRPPRGARAGPALAVAVSRVGLLAATVGDAARTWDLAGRTTRFAVRSPGDSAHVAWSRDGAFLAAGDGRGQVRITDRTGDEVAVLGPPREEVWVAAVSFSPDGRRIAVAELPFEARQAGAGAVTVWDWRRGVVVRTVRGGAEGVAFSRDGRLLAMANPVGPVQIRDAGSGRLVARLSGHTGVVTDVEFSPDGSTVATASADGTVRLWHARTWRQDLVLRGHDGVVWDVAFSPDGSRLASIGPEGLVRVWALDLDDLVALARRRLTRGLTAAECRQYLRGGCE